MEVTTKICTKCQIEKPIEEFSKKADGKNGLSSWCKSCCSEINKQWRTNNLVKHREDAKRWAKNNPDKGKESDKRYYIKNNEKCKERDKQWRINNPEKRKEKNRRYRINNPDKIKEINRICCRQWQKNNPEQVNSINSKRRALIRNSTVENVDLLQLYEDHKWLCGICGLKIDKKLKWPDSMCISHDHIIPISKGGSHTYNNIQPAHLVCNLRKNNRIDNIQLRLQTV